MRQQLQHSHLFPPTPATICGDTGPGALHMSGPVLPASPLFLWRRPLLLSLLRNVCPLSCFCWTSSCTMFGRPIPHVAHHGLRVIVRAGRGRRAGGPLPGGATVVGQRHMRRHLSAAPPPGGLRHRRCRRSSGGYGGKGRADESCSRRVNEIWAFRWNCAAVGGGSGLFRLQGGIDILCLLIICGDEVGSSI